MGRGESLHRILSWLGSRPSLLFLLWALWLSFPYFGFGASSYVWLPDNGDALLPMQLAKADDRVREQMGLWSHLAVSGTDGLSSLWIGEPLFALFALLPGWLFYGLIMGGQRFLAGFFMYRLMRDALSLETLPALYAGFAYALFCQGSINHQWAGFTLYDGLALPGIPFFLWALLQLDDRRKPVLYAGASILGVLLAATSLFYLAVFLFPVVFAWFFWITPRRHRSFQIAILLFGFSWALVEAPLLWAAQLNSPLSQRSLRLAGALSGDLLESWQFHLSLSGHLLRDSALSLSLAVLGRYASARKDRVLGIVLALFLGCLVYKLVYPFIARGLLDHMGSLKGFGFDRLYLLCPFLAATAGAIGLAGLGHGWDVRLSRPPSTARVIPLQKVAFAAAACLLAFQSALVLHDVLAEMASGRNFRNLYRNPSMLELAARREAGGPFRVATLAEFSSGRYRLHPGYAWACGLESADGYVNLFSRRYHQFWSVLIDPASRYGMEPLSRFRKGGHRLYLLAPGGDSADGPQGPLPADCFRPALLSLANVRFILSPRPLGMDGMVPVDSAALALQKAWEKRPLRDKLFGLIRGEYPGEPLYAYENLEVLPRAFLAERVERFHAEEQVLHALSRATRDELAVTAYLTHSDAQGLPDRLGGGKGGSVDIRDYRADRITLDIDARSDSVLVITNNYSPFWKAYVDGQQYRLFPADHAFQGLAVPRGRHAVVLSYEPPYAVSPRLYLR
ncbi:MAG: Bacterial membrane protein YfhO [Syntrophaceae bacterium PtaU1.Bin231]|nr:MAG: Bacterial membrane protein YfhO [Syntrophaceae bacterium PtaU1.Bin231]